MSRASSAQLDLIARDEQFMRVSGRVRRTMVSLAQHMQKVSRAARRVFLVGTAAISAITITAASFEKRMARVGAITQATADEMRELTGAARDMGRTTVFTANQAADAMAFFAQAGFNVRKILQSLQPTLNLAAAGQLDIATAADLVTNIMAGMGIEANKLDDVVDQLTKTFISSNTNLEMLAQAMKFVGPVAADAGLDLATTAAVIGKLSDAGLQATLAGTSLRMILLQLSDTGTEDKLAELGVTVRNVAGEMLSFTDILNNMSGAMKRLDPRKQSEMLGLFGARAGPGLRVLLRVGGDALKDFAKQIKNSGGVAQEVAEKQLDTLAGSFALLKSAAQEFALVLGDVLMPHIRGAADTLRGLTEQMNAMEKSTSEGLGKLLLWVTGLAGATFSLAAFGAAAAFTLGMLTKLLSPLVKVFAAVEVFAAGSGVSAGLALTVLGAAFVAAVSQVNTMLTIVQDGIKLLEKDLERVQKRSAKTGKAFQEATQGRRQVRSADRIRDPVENTTARVAGIEKQIAATRNILDSLRAAHDEMVDSALSTRWIDLEGPLRDTDRAILRTINRLGELRDTLKEAKVDEFLAPGESQALARLQVEGQRRLDFRRDEGAREKARADAFRQSGLDQPPSKRQVAARTTAADTLTRLKRERLIQMGILDERELLLKDLSRAGLTSKQRADLQSEIGKIDDQERKAGGAAAAAEEERGPSFIEGALQTFDRIQQAALDREPLAVARQQLSANQKSVEVQERGNEILRSLLDAIENQQSGFGP